MPTPASTTEESIPPALRPLAATAMPDDPHQKWPELRSLGSPLPLRAYLREMWEHREFAATVPMGQLEAQNSDTVLGRAWNLLNPLLLIAIYYLIFQVILGIESRQGVDNYLPFLTIGILTYDFSRSSVHGGATAIVKGRGLMQSLYFPRALLPVSSTIAQAVSHLWAVGAMLVLLPILGVFPRVSWLLLPVVFLMQTIMNLGIAMIVGRIAFHFRDFEKLLGYILRLGMYMSGVLIPVNAEIVSNTALLWLLKALPFFSIIEITRETLLGIPLDPVNWLLALFWSITLLLVGFWYFRGAENEYARV